MTHSCPLECHGVLAFMIGHSSILEQSKDAGRLLLGLGGERSSIFSAGKSSHPFTSWNLRPSGRRAISPLNQSLKPEYPRAFQFHDPINPFFVSFLLKPIWVRFSVTCKSKNLHWFSALWSAYWQGPIIFWAQWWRTETDRNTGSDCRGRAENVKHKLWIPSGPALLFLYLPWS